LNKLTNLTLGYNFNLQIEIPSNIKILTINCKNNLFLIENLPNSIEELNNLPRFLEITNIIMN